MLLGSIDSACSAITLPRVKNAIPDMLCQLRAFAVFPQVRKDLSMSNAAENAAANKPTVHVNKQNPAPLCYQCKFRGELGFSAHSSCTNQAATVTANPHGVKKGWFAHPFNFDPVWLETCTGFESK